MAERIRLKSFIVVSFCMTLVHSIPAHWVWSEKGFFYEWGVIDSAGCAVVHLVGGIAGTVATIYLRPRQNRFGEKGNQQLSNPTNAVLGQKSSASLKLVDIVRNASLGLKRSSGSNLTKLNTWRIYYSRFEKVSTCSEGLC